MALSSYHTDWKYGSYLDDLCEHLKQFENDKLYDSAKKGGHLVNLNAHFEGVSMAFG
ncbi:MAG: hypothetical protein LBG67_04100 [Campylobacteraceae bacterium]|jgi:hypothetical protein|nr:hypothetical protein [Campylobacteraceae bacterium]